MPIFGVFASVVIYNFDLFANRENCLRYKFEFELKTNDFLFCDEKIKFSLKHLAPAID